MSIDNVTPGEWFYNDRDVVVVTDRGFRICDMYEGDDTGDALLANGYLIAAAKELYGATKTLLTMVGDNKKRNCQPGACHWCDRVHMAEAALAKAEGRNP
jgi:hypothetical protein